MKRGNLAITNIVGIVLIVVALIVLLVSFVMPLDMGSITETIDKLGGQYLPFFFPEESAKLRVSRFSVEHHLGKTVVIEWIIKGELDYNIKYSSDEGSKKIDLSSAIDEDGVETLYFELPDLKEYTFTLSWPDSEGISRELSFEEFDKLSFQSFVQLNKYHIGRVLNQGISPQVFSNYKLAKNHIIVGFARGKVVKDNCQPWLGIGIEGIRVPEKCSNTCCLCLCHTKGSNHENSCENSLCFGYDELNQFLGEHHSDNPPVSKLERGKEIDDGAYSGNHYLALFGNCRGRKWDDMDRKLEITSVPRGYETAIKIITR